MSCIVLVKSLVLVISLLLKAGFLSDSDADNIHAAAQHFKWAFCDAAPGAAHGSHAETASQART
jgi:hypothetical protein